MDKQGACEILYLCERVRHCSWRGECYITLDDKEDIVDERGVLFNLRDSFESGWEICKSNKVKGCSMNRRVARKTMYDGEKIRFETWAERKYLVEIKGQIRDQDGILYDFNGALDRGWEIYKPKLKRKVTGGLKVCAGTDGILRVVGNCQPIGEMTIKVKVEEVD